MNSVKTDPHDNIEINGGSRSNKNQRENVRTFKERVKFFKKIPVFHHLTPEHYIKLMNISCEQKLPKYDVVLKQGDKPDTLYILKEGQVKIYCNESLITDMPAVNIFGEIGFLSGAPHLISVIATTDITVIEINRTKFLGLFRNDSVLRNTLLKNIIDEIAGEPGKYMGIIENEQALSINA